MAEKTGLPAPPEVGASALVPGTYDGVCVFVTGAGTGLGKAIAAEFARLGASIVVASRKPEHLEAGEEAMAALGAPVLTTTWRVAIDKEDFSILGFDFLPPVELRNVQLMGVRYRILKYDDIEGARIPSQVLAVGINMEGIESGANRITRIEHTVYGPWEAGLFANPRRLEALEGD